TPGESVRVTEGRREPWTVDRELPAATHGKTAGEGSGGLTEPAPVEMRAGGKGAGERERTVDPPGELQCTLGGGKRLVESPQLGQGRGDVVETELGQAELGRPPRWAVTRGDCRGRDSGSAALEEPHGLPVPAKAPVNLAEPEVRFHGEAAILDGLREVEGTWARGECSGQIAGEPGVIADIGRHAREARPILELLGDVFGFAQMTDQVVEAPHRVQALPQLDADIQTPVGDLTAPPAHVERA